MDRIGVEVHKIAKEEQSQYFQPCDRTNMVNKEFITWLSGKVFLWDTVGSVAYYNAGLSDGNNVETS